MKSKLSKNALIGLAFMASLVMIYFGINFLKGVNIFKKQNQYYAVFGDVSKLLVSSPVYVKGYQVGLISKIKMVSSNPMQFLVEINLEEDILITKGSYLEYNIDMFGASTVNLVMVPTDSYLQPGDTLTGDREIGLMDGVVGVMPKADSILLRIDSVVYTLNRLMSNPMWEASIEGINSTVDQLNQSSKGLSRVVGSLEKDLPVIGQNLADVSGDLKVVSSELTRLDLQGTLGTIEETLDNLKQMTEKMNSNDGSLGLLLNDTKLHDSLSMTIENATKLLEDIREHPDRYLTIRLRLF